MPNPPYFLFFRNYATGFGAEATRCKLLQPLIVQHRVTAQGTDGFKLPSTISLKCVNKLEAALFCKIISLCTTGVWINTITLYLSCIAPIVFQSLERARVINVARSCSDNYVQCSTFVSTTPQLGTGTAARRQVRIQSARCHHAQPHPSESVITNHSCNREGLML